MFVLAMLLVVISMICVPIGAMKFPWAMRSYAALSPSDRSRFWNGLALMLIPLSLVVTMIDVWQGSPQNLSE